MQCLSNRSRTAVAVIAGVSSGVGLALLAFKIVPRFLMKRLNSSSSNSLCNMTVKVANNEIQCVSLVSELKRHIETCRVVGFDCEWVSSKEKRNPVALLQLATQQGLCGLFQVQFYSPIPTPLRDLLEDRSILKVGVSCLADAGFLFDDYGIKVSGTVDIRHFVDLPPGKDLVGGLASVVYSELQVKLKKNFHVRVSNWEADKLTPEQEDYAAQDALSSLLAFNSLMNKKVKVPFFSSQEHKWQIIYDYCAPFLDVNFRQCPPSSASAKQIQVLERPPSGQPHRLSPSLQEKRSYHAFCPRKSPFYENACLLAPDGKVLCTCNSKKANWYVSKGLAIVINKEPLRVQLTFQPSIREEGTSTDYYTQEKENQCVACGKKDEYVRKKVVPHEYRRYFPDCLKKNQSHDILLLCTLCHVYSDISDLKLKKELAQLCNAPISCEENAKVVEDFKCKTLRSAARALLKQPNKLPASRRKELIFIIEENCKRPVTNELLNHLKDFEIMTANRKYVPHGLLVVKFFAEDGIEGLMKLERKWRKHFVTVMEPKYLPPLWSVDYSRGNECTFSLDSEFLKRIEHN